MEAFCDPLDHSHVRADLGGDVPGGRGPAVGAAAETVAAVAGRSSSSVADGTWYMQTDFVFYLLLL